MKIIFDRLFDARRMGRDIHDANEHFQKNPEVDSIVRGKKIQKNGILSTYLLETYLMEMYLAYR